MHSLNILVKYTRLYGFDHKRTEGQFDITWNELQQGLPATGDSGFLLGCSDNKLLLDGTPLEAGQAEKSFAELLTTAGLASIHFSQNVTKNDFTRLVKAFTSGGSKAQDVAQQVKEALGDGSGGSIKINEVRFVAAYLTTGEISIAAQIAAQTLGPEFKQWLSEPQKLLQLIAAAEGAQSGGSGPGARSGAFPTLGWRNRDWQRQWHRNMGRRHGSAAGRSDPGHPSADQIWRSWNKSQRYAGDVAAGTQSG